MPSFILFSLLLLIAGTRFETGNDWREYTLVFNRLPDLLGSMLIEEQRMERGYIFLNRLLKSLGAQHVGVVFFICAAFSVYSARRAILQYSPLPMLSVILYMRYFFIQTNMAFVRQGVVISLLFLALPLIIQRRLYAYLFIILIASSFHSSAVIALPIYWFYGLKIPKKTMLMILFACLIIAQQRWLDSVTFLIPIEDIKNKVVSYLHDDRWNAPIGISFSVIERFIIFATLFHYREKLLERFPENFSLFFNMFFAGLCISLLFYQYNVFLERFILYFNIANLFVIPYIVTLFEKQSRVYVVTLISLCCIYWFVRYVYAVDSIYIPYQSFLIK